jgi:hypothetical protein
MQNLEIFPTEELKEEKFNPYDSRWNGIKKTLYHLHMTFLIEEIMKQAPISDFEKLPAIVRNERPYSFWFEVTKRSCYRQWCYFVKVDYNIEKNILFFHLQSRSSWIDWNKFDKEKALDVIIDKVKAIISTEKNKPFIDNFLRRAKIMWVIHKDSTHHYPSFEHDKKYID